LAVLADDAPLILEVLTDDALLTLDTFAVFAAFVTFGLLALESPALATLDVLLPLMLLLPLLALLLVPTPAGVGTETWSFKSENEM